MPALIERNRFAARLCDSLGTSGVALEGRVFLAPQADARVLRHELAHLAQQRLWRGRAVPTAWTEAEAHAVAAGLLPRPRLPLDPRLPACWEEVGHYYTVYYVLFAIGVRDDLARRIAFYAQMPDEISDLDAVRAGYSLPGAAVSGVGGWIHEHTVGAFEEGVAWLNNGFASMIPDGYGSSYMIRREAPRQFVDYTRALDVQQGLHALTGAACEVETTRRTGILQSIDPIANTMEFGLALHAFGDSYAHRRADGARMFPPISGHAPDSVAARGQRATHLPEMDVHPDAVGPHHAALYLRYAGDMYRAFLHAIPPGSRVGAPMDPNILTANLRTVIAASNAAADTEAEHRRQIALLREMARAIVPAGMHPYDPENQEDVPIDSFTPGHTDIRVTQPEVRRALLRASEWSIAGR